MFTGLIEALGTVASLDRVEGGYRLVVTAPLAAELRAGDSLAVNGVCLTVAARDGDRAAFDIGPETRRVTILGTLEPGTLVNLERAMRADTRVGGHFVQGHVDGMGTLVELRGDAEFTWMALHVSRRGGGLPDSEGRRGSGRRQPDRGNAGGRQVRRADHPVHVDAYQPVGSDAWRPREPRVRHAGQIRRPRGDFGRARRSDSNSCHDYQQNATRSIAWPPGGQ